MLGITLLLKLEVVLVLLEMMDAQEGEEEHEVALVLEIILEIQVSVVHPIAKGVSPHMAWATRVKQPALIVPFQILEGVSI